MINKNMDIEHCFGNGMIYDHDFNHLLVCDKESIKKVSPDGTLHLTFFIFLITYILLQV